MNVNIYSTKDYENEPRLRAPGKQTQSNPIKPNFKGKKMWRTLRPLLSWQMDGSISSPGRWNNRNWLEAVDSFASIRGIYPLIRYRSRLFLEANKLCGFLLIGTGWEAIKAASLRQRNELTDIADFTDSGQKNACIRVGLEITSLVL